MTIAVKAKGAAHIKFIDGVDQDDDLQRMVRLYTRDSAIKLYRIIEERDGDVLLKLVRPVPGSEVHQPKIVDVQFEDVNPDGN